MIAAISSNHSIAVGVGVGILIIIAGVGIVFASKMGGTNSKDSKPENDGKKKQKSEEKSYPGGKVSVYYGSQTGTAESFARTLANQGKELGFDCRTVDLEDFDPEVLASENIAVFLMATYGEGEPTDNAVKFVKWLKTGSTTGEDVDESAIVGYLSKVKFSVFGLGNRQYEHYNLMGKTVNKLLGGEEGSSVGSKVGAKRVFEYGEGDDDGTLEEDFEKWKDSFWPSIVKQFHPDHGDGATTAPAADAAGEASTSISTAGARVKLQFEVKAVPPPADPSLAMLPVKMHNSHKHFFTSPEVPIIATRELRNTASEIFNEQGVGSIGSTKHIEFDLRGSGVSYYTADNLAILPENDAALVSLFAQAQGYDLDQYIDLSPVDGAAGGEGEFKRLFPSPCTVRDLLTKYVDIQGAMRYSTMKTLLPYVTNPEQHAWLEDKISKENRPKLKEYIDQEGISLVSLLHASGELSSCKLPLSDLLHIAQFVQPRYYTISSSSLVHPDTVHVTVSITEYLLSTGKKFSGLTSSYLKKLTANVSNGGGHGVTRCRVFVRPSSFRLPKSLSTPIIMIGPGTGLAPMRAFLQERQHLMKATPLMAGKTCENVLFFGCKRRDEDFIYNDELEQYQATNVLTKFYTAFSREQTEKVYVQHLMQEKETAKTLVDMLKVEDSSPKAEGAYLYVCGATSMGNDVHSTLIKLVQEQKGYSAVAATEYIKKLQAEGRYVQELWST